MLFSGRMPQFQGMPPDVLARLHIVHLGGHPELGASIEKRQPFSFTDIGQLRQWVLDLERITGLIVNSRQQSELQINLEALYAREIEEMRHEIARLMEIVPRIGNTDMTSKEPDTTSKEIEEMIIRGASSKKVAEDIFKDMQEALKIARSVKSSLQRFDIAKKREPIGEILGGLIGAGIAFLCGILLPMFWHNVPVVLLLWVPSGFYVIAFAYIMSSVWKILVV